MAYDKVIAVITIAAEASGESHSVRQGVCASFFNRLALGRYGTSIAAICTERNQYSCWNGDVVNRNNLLRVMKMPEGDAVLLDCAVAYDEVAAGADPTEGGTHYYDVSIPEPSWARDATFTMQLGKLRFYKGVP